MTTTLNLLPVVRADALALAPVASTKLRLPTGSGLGFILTEGGITLEFEGLFTEDSYEAPNISSALWKSMKTKPYESIATPSTIRKDRRRPTDSADKATSQAKLAPTVTDCP
ncbi:MAG: hypothetical protein Q8N47_01780 [Bryobacterales bacterium]|nr:hypothetical protein [Bryobacterales bacterium]